MRGATWDGIIANAFYDLVDLDSVLPILHNLLKPGGWIYATINFDGCTIFEPVIDEALDSLIIDTYHNSMDERNVNGVPVSGSQSGRRLYYAFRNYGFKIGKIGSSDWLVYPQNGAYSADEKYFLEVILSFFQKSVMPSHLLSQSQINKWLDIRKKAIGCRGITVYCTPIGLFCHQAHKSFSQIFPPTEFGITIKYRVGNII